MNEVGSASLTFNTLKSDKNGDVKIIYNVTNAALMRRSYIVKFSFKNTHKKQTNQNDFRGYRECRIFD